MRHLIHACADLTGNPLSNLLPKGDTLCFC